MIDPIISLLLEDLANDLLDLHAKIAMINQIIKNELEAAQYEAKGGDYDWRN